AYLRAFPVTVSGFSAAAAVTAGELHSLALKSDGSVWSWGADGSGQLGNGRVIGSVADPAPVNWLSKARADFEGDGRSDILWHNSSTGDTAIWLMNGVTLTSSVLLPAVTDRT